jgi:predicted transcriptional regulator
MAMTLRLTGEETAALRRTAEQEHRSMQEVARDAIVGYTCRHAQRRAELPEEIMAEHAGAFERLANAWPSRLR